MASVSCSLEAITSAKKREDPEGKGGHVDGISRAPKMVATDVPERGRIYYLVDDQYKFIPEAKAFFDWNAAANRAPATLKAYCSRLLWYYRFL